MDAFEEFKQNLRESRQLARHKAVAVKWPNDAAMPDVCEALEKTLAFARALEKQSGRGAGGRRGGGIFSAAEAALSRARGETP